MAASVTALPSAADSGGAVVVVRRPSIFRQIWNQVCRFASWVGGGIKEIGRACSRAARRAWSAVKGGAREVWTSAKAATSRCWIAIRGASQYIWNSVKSLGGFVVRIAVAIWHAAVTLVYAIGGPIWLAIALVVGFVIAFAQTVGRGPKVVLATPGALDGVAIEVPAVDEKVVVKNGTPFTEEQLHAPWGKNRKVDLFRSNLFLKSNVEEIELHLEDLRIATAANPDDPNTAGRYEFLSKWKSRGGAKWLLPSTDRQLVAALTRDLKGTWSGSKLEDFKAGVREERKEWLNRFDITGTTTVTPTA